MMRVPSTAEAKMREQRAQAAVACLAYGVAMSDRLLFSVAVVPMGKELEWDARTQGLLLSSFGWGYICTQVIGGLAAARIGSNRVLVGAVTVWSACTLFLPPVAYLGSSFTWLLFLLRILLGFGEGLALPAIYHLLGSLSSSPDDDEKRVAGSEDGERKGRAGQHRSEWIAFLYACGGCGHLLALFICPWLSWPWMFFSFGAIGAVWVAAFIIIGQNDYSLRYGESSLSPSRRWNWKEYASCRPLWAIVAAHMSSNSCLWFLSLWLPTILHERYGIEGRTLGMSAMPTLVSVIVGPIVGKYITNHRLEEHFGKRTLRNRMTFIALWGQSISFLLAAVASSAWGMILCLSLAYACKTAACGGWEASHADITSSSGFTYGISNTFATIPAILLGPLVVRILEWTDGSWTVAFSAIAAAPLLGSLLYSKNMSTERCLL